MNDAPAANHKTRLRLADTADPTSLSSRFRQKRDLRLRELIGGIAGGGKPLRILDVGGSVEYWRRVGLDFLRDVDARVVVMNVTAFELKAEGADATLFEAVVGDACDLSAYPDGGFDLVHSNSVIEHVGNWSRMKQFASETRRVGRSYYVQTPYYWFPIEPHFYRAPMIHWMPRPLAARVMTTFPVTYSGKAKSLDAAFGVLDGTQLIDRRQFRLLFPDAQHVSERVLGLTKSQIAIRRA
ncbi:MAG: methyltransferase domain-containing protein [Phenylobacterium sp.]|uniref:methyltransferase domain-containing protein n=1 Tax=Phenylobacterium sp. TaxID=1871053 RepID=UPI001A37D58F|nr:class I SAM-dependent methyltransferase [Phenylobacterium sp.]MBL8772703.1 methyltransferase domain-containing protein [Phenylobacterium sp.]